MIRKQNHHIVDVAKVLLVLVVVQTLGTVDFEDEVKVTNQLTSK